MPCGSGSRILWSVSAIGFLCHMALLTSLCLPDPMFNSSLCIINSFICYVDIPCGFLYLYDLFEHKNKLYSTISFTCYALLLHILMKIGIYSLCLFDHSFRWIPLYYLTRNQYRALKTFYTCSFSTFEYII